MTPRPAIPVRLLLGIVLAASLTAVPVAALAEESSALIREGVMLRRAGDNAAALEVFQRAYALHPTPRAAAQIALAHQALGDWVEAEAKLMRVLEDREDRWIARHRNVLEMALQTIRDHLGTLHIEVNVEGAAIQVDGNHVGESPLADGLRAPAGTIELKVHAEGYAPVERAVQIPARGQVHEAVLLQRAHDATPSPSSGQVATQPVDRAPPKVLPVSTQERAVPAGALSTSTATSTSARDDDGLLEQPVFWVGVGTAVVAAGVAAFVIANSEQEQPMLGGSLGEIVRVE